MWCYGRYRKGDHKVIVTEKDVMLDGIDMEGRALTIAGGGSLSWPDGQGVEFRITTIDGKYVAKVVRVRSEF